MGLDTLQSRTDRAKMKWWYKLATLSEDTLAPGIRGYPLLLVPILEIIEYTPHSGKFW